jgi:hypothetical protein
MRALQRLVAAATIATVSLAPAVARAQSFALDPASNTLALLGIGSSNVLVPAVPPAPGPLPLPVVGFSTADLGLLPGDVIDALSFGDDFAVGTLYFTVSRGSVSAPGPLTPNVFSEVTGVPIGTQPEASSDIFSTLDPAGVPPGFNSQVLDGNGLAPLAPLTTYTGRGIGLSELNALPGPPRNDQIADFDWSSPGRARLFSVVFFSLAPGSPSLTPATNPNFPAGAEPGDILGSSVGTLSFHFIAVSAAANGLISCGPGCAPPACDDIDAITFGGAFLFSQWHSLPRAWGSSPAVQADVLNMFSGTPPTVAFPAVALGLAPGDDVKGLETIVNGCPVHPGRSARQRRLRRL